MGEMRVLQLESNVISSISVRELVLLCEMLRPGMLLIDDIDHASADGLGARLLYVIERVKPAIKCSVAITANDPTKVDYALFRGERIDEAIEFYLPCADERRQIVQACCHGIADVDTDRIVTSSAEFSHADVAAYARRVSRLASFEKAHDQINHLRSLAERALARSNAPAQETKPCSSKVE